jgi:hypothetical protein
MKTRYGCTPWNSQKLPCMPAMCQSISVSLDGGPLYAGLITFSKPKQTVTLGLLSVSATLTI